MSKTLNRRTGWITVCLILLAGSVTFSAEDPQEQPAWSPSAQPKSLKGVGYAQNLNAQLPLDAKFRGETGRIVKLGDYFGEKPVVLALVYYECPMLCNLVLNGLTDVLQQVPFEMGRDFEVVTISFDHEETHVLAAEKKQNYVKRYGRPGAEDGWHFLVGDEAEIEKVTKAVGFDFSYDPASDEFMHASGFTVSTPAGRLSHYFYGIDYPPQDLRLALVEASDGGIGSAVDQFLLFCYHYDPETGRYGMVINRVLTVACMSTVVLLGCTVGGFVWRERKRNVRGTEGGQ
ncbi:MAG: SCO family protein [Verrucomicrobia bacterium]|nr:SCO family protein [Verrucomicrobiota bacterium]